MILEDRIHKDLSDKELESLSKEAVEVRDWKFTQRGPDFKEYRRSYNELFETCKQYSKELRYRAYKK